MDDEKLYKLYELYVEEENYFLSEHQHRVAFYIGLISAILAVTVTGILTSDKWFYCILLMLGPLLIAFVSFIALKGINRLYQRFLEAITTLKKIEYDLGLTEKRNRNLSNETDWVANEQFIPNRHKDSGVCTSDSAQWVANHMIYSRQGANKQNTRNYNGVTVLLFKASCYFAIGLFFIILMIGFIRFKDQKQNLISNLSKTTTTVSEPTIASPDLLKVTTKISGPDNKCTYLSVDSNIVSIEQLRGDFYQEAMECFRREMDNYKWTIEIALVCIGIVVTLWGVLVGYLGYKQKEESAKSAQTSESSAKRSESSAQKCVEKSGLIELWSEASLYYSAEEYQNAAEIWSQIYKIFKPNTRQFYNNWGSSLLNWAGTIEKGEKQKQLANEAIEKYLKAEEFTKGIAAYNIACCYTILDNPEKCKEWLETAKQTGRLLSWERASTDRDLKKHAGEKWFKQIWGQ